MVSVSFEGHKLCKIDREWVFDLTEFTGYKVDVENGKVKGIQRAFTVTRNDNDGTYQFNRLIKEVNLGVLRKSKHIIENYFKEALLYG